MINKDTIDRIMDATRIEEVIGEFVSLKKRGAGVMLVVSECIDCLMAIRLKPFGCISRHRYRDSAA